MTPLELASAPRQSHVSRRLELTLGQRRLWALERRRPGDPAYHQLSAIRLEGRLHRAALQAALAQVIERHASLRARFPTEGNTPVCIIDAEGGVSLRHYDLSPLPPESRARAVVALARREARRPFDLAGGPLLRASLLMLDADEAVLVLCFHHMIIDGWSLGTLLGELCRTYAALSEGLAPPAIDPGPAYSLDDYVAESLAASRSPEGASALAYWSKHLAGISWSRIPYENEWHGDAQVRTGRTLRRYWDGLRDAIDAAARQQQVTRYQLLLCAFLQHVAECTGNPDVAIATLLANRSSRERQTLVGFLANTVILRHRFATGEDARSRLKRVAITLRDMLRHGDVSLHSIAEEIPGVLDKPPSILFSLQNNPLPTFRAGNLRLSMLDIDSGAAKFDLSIYVAERGAGLDLWIEYDTSLYGGASVDEFMERFRLMLETLCSDLGQDVSRGTGALHHMPPCAAPGMISPAPRGKGLLEAFYDTIASAPARTALEVDGHRYTFAEVRRDIAAALAGLRGIGARPGDRVAVLGARTRATLATIWACLIARLTYVPISPDLPRARMLQILDDADPAWRVADHEANPPGEWHDVRQWLGKSGDEEAPLPALPADRNAWPAYILYTSGSTGVPKGVVVSQGNLAVFCAAMDATIPRGDREVWLAVSPLSFDISVLELFWAMSRGMCVRVAAMADLVASDDRIERTGEIPDLGVAFFGSTDQYAAEEHLDLVESVATWADDNGFRTLWTPERHFGAFGGFFSNPALMSSHLLARTRRIRVHAGSVIAPLHRTARLAEDWAALSRMSGGRAGLSLAPGWNPSDFVLADVSHAERHDAVARQADELRALWRGETVAFPDPDGRFFDVRLPLACPDGLPLAMTVSHRGEQFEAAATRGLDVLTHLLEQGLPELAANIERYRQAWERQHGAGSTPGRVTVMIHTYVGSDADDALARALPPLARYLGSAGAALRSLHAPVATAAALDGELLEIAARRMIRERSLIGDAASVATTLCSLYGIGVDEVASLVDFGLSRDEVLAGLDRLAALRTPPASTDTEQFPVTHFQCTPSAARLLVRREGGLPAALDKLECWAIGGEAMDADLIRRLRLRSGARVFNMYGPTETTVWASSAILEPRRSGPITIGSGLPDYGLYVLDDELRPVPTEVEGQLYIAGDGVAQGYWRRPAATAAAFVPSPFGPPGARLYASGDRVRRRHDGALVFVGRRDSQAKINGHRVDLAGLRALLVLHEDIIDAHLHCVAADAATHAGQSIVAFVILREAHAANALQSLHDHLARYCEVAVLPREFIALKAFPMTASQKLDARRLDELYREHLASRESIPDVSEEDPEAAELRELWQSMLPAFTDRADFHRAGGNSLIAMQLLARANAHFGAQTTLVEFYRTPTLQGHLATIRGSRATHRAVPLVPGERKGAYPVSFAQRAMLIVDELAGDRIAYHDDVTLRLRGDLQVDILADAYAGMLRRHRLFSTAYRFDGNDYLQWWRDEPAAGLRTATLNEGASLDEVLDRFRHERFDLGAGDVVRALLLTLSPHEHVLCLVLHHIVSDGTTLRLLLDEWLERYRLGSQGKAPDATEAAWQYVDFVEWQKRRVEAREAELHAFWDDRLKECLDAPGAAVTEGHAAELTVGLDETETGVIDGMIRDHRAGEFSALIFPMVMALESGSAGTVILATDVRNRERPEFEAVPGMMVNQLLLPLHLPEVADATAATAALHDQVVACLSHQELPYERLVSRWRRLTGRQDEPPFDVKFVLNEPARPSHLDGLEVSEHRLPARHAKFGVLINLRRDGKRYTGTLVYDSARHSADWVRSLWADYRWLLSRLGGMTDLAEERVALAAHRAGQQAGKDSPGLARLRTARRRVGRVESAPVKVVEEPHVPVVQAWPGAPGQTLAAAVTRSREVLVSQVLSRGAVLLRGFAGVDAEALTAAVDILCGPALAYTERSTPRTELGKRLYSATEYPAHQRIDLHNENSYAARWPGTLFFWCACPAETGGENLLADSRRLLERIPRGIVQTFERAGVLYRRELGPPLGMPWRYVFQCNTPDELDTAAHMAGYAVRWHSPERLTLSRRGQAIIVHPVTGERSWFNHALFFHESSLPGEIRSGLGTLYGNDYLPHRSFLGDGSPIPPRVIAELRHAYAECERDLLLRKDDILILDNLLIAHGRRPFTGRRDIRLMMGNTLGMTQ